MKNKPRNGFVRVPDDVSSVCVTDTAGESKQSALSAQDVDAIWQRTIDLYRSGAYPGVGICVRHNGQLVLNRTIGHARGNGPREQSGEKVLLKPDTPVCVFSASKAVTAVLMHKLAEDGLVSLHDRVVRYIPEFAQHGKSRTTIEQVLGHRGGFPHFDIPREKINPDLLLDWKACVNMICDAEPLHRRPHLAYHALTGGYILAEVIQRVTGQSLREYLDEKLRKPLGMKHFTFGVPREHRGIVAHNYVAGARVDCLTARLLQGFLMVPLDRLIDISNSDAFFDAVIPAGNLYCTSDELSRFYQMLLDNGRWSGQEILQPDTVALLREPTSRLRLDRTLKLPMRYSMGMMLGGNPVGLYGPMSGRAFGHIGLMNVFGWADPARNLSAALLTTGKAVIGGHLIALAKWQATLARVCKA